MRDTLEILLDKTESLDNNFVLRNLKMTMLNQTIFCAKKYGENDCFVVCLNSEFRKIYIGERGTMHAQN